MRKITTVTGDIEPGELGHCQCHEHLLIGPGISGEINPALHFEDVDKSTREAKAYRAAGGGALVDAQPGGCSRRERGLQQISRDSGVAIISSTGFHKMIFYPESHWIFRYSQKEIADIFTEELTRGMFYDIDDDFSGKQRDIRAGIVKMAIDKENLTPQYKKILAAGVQGACKADTAMMVHIEFNSDPEALLDYLMEQGGEPRRMIFCHMDRAIPDLEVHKRILKQGVYLEYDTIGRFKYHSDERELEIFREMADGGYLSQLLFSLDTTKERMKAYNPEGVGLDYILREFIPSMEEVGFTREDIRTIAEENCRRVL